MKLHENSFTSLSESRLFHSPIITEASGALRWDFDYDTPKSHDKHPDVLVLGQYHNDNTGNDLVGAVNLHYLNRKQFSDLRRTLPEIMKGSNLYHRYWLGRRLLPDIFNEKYRTYSASEIRGLSQGTIYPKLGFLQASRALLGKTLGSLFKSKAQRAKEALPSYPQDLETLRQQADLAAQQLPQHELITPADEPEIKAALKARQDQAQAQTIPGIEQNEDEPFLRANQQLQQQQMARGEATPQQTQLPPPEPELQEPTEMKPQNLGKEFERERAEHREELLDPKNDLDLDNLEEAIIYYDPRRKSYVIEKHEI